MIALARMRLIAFVRTQVALAPLLAALVLLGIFYGGGQASPTEAYGMSAVILFPIFAWQVKILLDVEPDVQRQIAATAVGSRRRELLAGLLAAAMGTGTTVLIGLSLPWIVGGVTLAKSPTGLATALLIGLWAHVAAIPPALALGALASRAITRKAGAGLLVLVTGTVLAIVLGLKGSPAPWLVPPIMPTARAVVTGLTFPDCARLTLWSLLWSATALAGYAALRHPRP